MYIGLLEHEANTALVGGTNLMLASSTTAGICKLQALSIVGRSRTFESRCAPKIVCNIRQMSLILPKSNDRRKTGT